MSDAAYTKPEPMILNAFQKAVLEDYSDGDYAYLAEDGAIEDVMALGDTLLSFMLIELSNKEGCSTIGDAEGRLHSAHAEIDVALAALDKLAEVIAEKLEIRSSLQRET